MFFDDEHQGTDAAIFSDAENYTLNHMQQLAQATHCGASVFVINHGKNPTVRIFNATNEIQWCGHGLLAAAYYLSLSQSIENIGLTSDTVEIAKENGRLWVGFESLPIQQGIPAEIDDNQLTQAFSHQPLKVSFVGNENGYLIMEWSSDFDLAALELDFNKIMEATHRAIIATQKSDDKYHFKLRYFAPYHGVKEDPATGSANRILALYWQKKLGTNQFVAEQVSAAGGVILSKVEKNKVWISGKVKLIKD